jgi:tRNA threonylcarbamoyladenosine biosynthesis protein TsaE
LSLIADTAGDMRALGAALSGLLRPGDVLLLTGGMGAGKSEFCRGLARGLGIGGPVPSPTFTILNVYEEGRLPLHHFDWYRVSGAEELIESGLDELIQSSAVTAIEWHERAPELLPSDCLEVAIEQERGKDLRCVRFLPRGGFRLPGLDDIIRAKEDGR